MTTAAGPFDALLLLSFGGPDKPDDVRPFLENVTRGRGVPPERLDEVADGRIRCGCRELQERTGLDASASWSARSSAVTKARAAEREAGGLLVEEHCGTSEHAQLCGTTGAIR